MSRKNSRISVNLPESRTSPTKSISKFEEQVSTNKDSSLTTRGKSVDKDTRSVLSEKIPEETKNNTVTTSAPRLLKETAASTGEEAFDSGIHISGGGGGVGAHLDNRQPSATSSNINQELSSALFPQTTPVSNSLPENIASCKVEIDPQVEPVESISINEFKSERQRSQSELNQDIAGQLIQNVCPVTDNSIAVGNKNFNGLNVILEEDGNTVESVAGAAVVTEVTGILYTGDGNDPPSISPEPEDGAQSWRNPNNEDPTGKKESLSFLEPAPKPDIRDGSDLKKDRSSVTGAEKQSADPMPPIPADFKDEMKSSKILDDEEPVRKTESLLEAVPILNTQDGVCLKNEPNGDAVDAVAPSGKRDHELLLQSDDTVSGNVNEVSPPPDEIARIDMIIHSKNLDQKAIPMLPREGTSLTTEIITEAPFTLLPAMTKQVTERGIDVEYSQQEEKDATKVQNSAQLSRAELADGKAAKKFSDATLLIGDGGSRTRPDVKIETTQVSLVERSITELIASENKEVSEAISFKRTQSKAVPSFGVVYKKKISMPVELFQFQSNPNSSNNVPLRSLVGSQSGKYLSVACSCCYIN